MVIRPNIALLKAATGVASLLLCAAPGWAQTHFALPLPQLTTAQQVRVLSPDEANRGYPVRLRAVVTYCDPGEIDFFVQDSTAGIYVNDPNLKAAFMPGDLLEVEGVTEQVDFAPQIAKPRYRVIGHAPLPRPQPASYDALTSTREDSQWVQFEGIVQSASLDRGHLTLDVVGGGGHLTAYILDGASLSPAALVDAKVRLEGVSIGIFNRQQQLIGVQIKAPGPNELQVLEAPATYPFALPLRALKDVMIFTPQGTTEHRIRVQGTVTLQRPKGFFVQDGTQGLYVPGVPQETLIPGERVDVVGFADIGDYTPVLRQAIVRRSGSAPLPPPVPITARQAMAGSFDTLRVRLEGTLQDQTNSETDRQLVLQDDGVLFEARIEGRKVPPGWPHLSAGSRLRLTGVCSVSVNRDRVPNAFIVLLASPADLAVLSRPSWWTLRNTLAGLAALAVVTIVVLAWVAVLRRQIRRAEARVRVLFAAIPHPAYVFDLKSLQFLEVNDFAVEHYGYSREEFLNGNAAEMHPAEEEERLKKYLRQGHPDRDASGEWKHRTKDGRLLDVELTFQTIDFKGGKAALTVAQDITERKRAEESLRQSQADFAAAQKVARLGTWRFDRVNNRVTWSEELYRIFDIEEAAFGKAYESFLGCVHPDDKARVVETNRKANETGHPFDFDYRILTRTGEVKHIREIGHAVKGPAGNVVGLFGTAQDVTDRIRAEETLREQQILLKSIINQIPYSIFWKDRNGVFQGCNEHFVREYGLESAESLIGRTDHDTAATSEEADSYAACDRRVMQANTPLLNVEETQTRPAGVYATILTSKVPLHNGKGEVTGVLGIYADITERKRAEEALRHRTVELERSNAELEQFAYVASHDLQEPLRMVTNFTQLLAIRYEGRLDRDADDFIRFAVEGATRMQALINGLLSFARVKSRGGELVPTDTEAVFTRSLATLQVAIREAGGEVTHDPLPSVFADDVQLEQVFQNLLSNALKFRNSKPPRVHVSAGRDGSEWTFSVRDNGIGIDPAYFERIFVIFQRLHTRQEYPGAGIGLSICRRIVERHGGRMWVESAAGSGATFYFTLPVLSASQDECARGVAAGSA